MFVEKFYDCLKHDGIVAVATASKDAKAHVVNTWNKYVIVTDDEKLLIPCYGFCKTISLKIPMSKLPWAARTLWAIKAWEPAFSSSARLNSRPRVRSLKKCTINAILPTGSWYLRRKNAPR